MPGTIYSHQVFRLPILFLLWLNYPDTLRFDFFVLLSRYDIQSLIAGVIFIGLRADYSLLLWETVVVAV